MHGDQTLMNQIVKQLKNLVNPSHLPQALLSESESIPFVAFCVIFNLTILNLYISTIIESVSKTNSKMDALEWRLKATMLTEIALLGRQEGKKSS